MKMEKDFYEKIGLSLKKKKMWIEYLIRKNKKCNRKKCKE